MTPLDVGKKLVELCRQGKNLEAIDKFYDKDIVSIEPADMPEMPAKMTGKATVRGKTVWWFENSEVHSSEVYGPFPNGDRFAVIFKIDVSCKKTGQRCKMEEVALYTVKNGLIVHEEFFYEPMSK